MNARSPHEDRHRHAVLLPAFWRRHRARPCDCLGTDAARSRRQGDHRRFKEERDEGLQVERIGRNVLIPFNRAYVDYTIGWNLKGQLKALFRRHDFDLIHTHCPAAPSLPLLARRGSTSVRKWVRFT